MFMCSLTKELLEVSKERGQVSGGRAIRDPYAFSQVQHLPREITDDLSNLRCLRRERLGLRHKKALQAKPCNANLRLPYYSAGRP